MTYSISEEENGYLVTTSNPYTLRYVFYTIEEVTQFLKEQETKANNES